MSALDMARFMGAIASAFTPEQQATIEAAARAEVQRVADDRAEAERIAHELGAAARGAAAEVDAQLDALMQDFEAVTRAGIVNGDTQAIAEQKLRAWVSSGRL